jgi:hypothetical protein
LTREFEYAWNEDFILAPQPPADIQEPVHLSRVDTGTINWYVIQARTGQVHGPLTEPAYRQACQELGVPGGLAFTTTVNP